MYGPKPYLDFGIKGKQLMEIATQEEDTCIDVQHINKGCKDNMLVENKLTSGYHHGRGNVKPPRSRGSKTGKCSHGGPADTSRRLPAKCGINKDTTIERLSPHYHLHDEAYLAAVAATKHFLIDKDTGILQHLGNELFDLLFHIKQRRKVSLSFAVDYSGSMASEIAATKNTIIELVTSTLGSDNEPANYVLSLFNDPASLNKAYVFSSGTEMIQAISNVSVHGGGDCPELAAAGILNAIELSLPDSTIIVFTDADAKDVNLKPEIETKAALKQIKVTTLKTGLCRRRKRNADSAYRYRRDTTFFESVAAITGGKVYDTNKTDIGNVLDEVIKEVFPTSEVLLEYFTWKSEENQTRAVFVDKSMQILKIVIKGATRREEIDFEYPNGTRETFSTPTATRILTDKNDLIMSIQKLSPGMYYLRRTKMLSYKVNMTAQSSIEVDGEIIEENVNGSSLSVEGSP
ncbi:von Willebrand factor A domain-containing protein 7-like [Mytilus trossulus]|uniref:von Willebrand factor A domain-containing protein 7-like n=1 Tax=Mytilus trossulus TaxID=6551 RepID=UPI003005EDB7